MKCKLSSSGSFGLILVTLFTANHTYYEISKNQSSNEKINSVISTLVKGILCAPFAYGVSSYLLSGKTTRPAPPRKNLARHTVLASTVNVSSSMPMVSAANQRLLLASISIEEWMSSRGPGTLLEEVVLGRAADDLLTMSRTFGSRYPQDSVEFSANAKLHSIPGEPVNWNPDWKNRLNKIEVRHIELRKTQIECLESQTTEHYTKYYTIEDEDFVSKRDRNFVPTKWAKRNSTPKMYTTLCILKQLFLNAINTIHNFRKECCIWQIPNLEKVTQPLINSVKKTLKKDYEAILEELTDEEKQRLGGYTTIRENDWKSSNINAHVHAICDGDPGVDMLEFYRKHLIDIQDI